MTLLERNRPGAEASSAAAGLLFSLGDSPEVDAFDDLARRSVQLYRGIADELRELTAIDVEYMTAGTIYPLLSASELAGARARARWPSARELGVEVLEGAVVHEREPALAKDIAAALFVQADHWVNNERLVLAYAAAAARRGVDVRIGVEVSRIVVEGGRARGVVAAGERIDADAVLLAAGAWSGALIDSFAGAQPGALPVAPVKGQMLAVSNSPPLLSHAVHAGEVYLVPRPSGELLIGATVEHAGFARDVTAGGWQPDSRRGPARARGRAAPGHTELVWLPAVGARRDAGARAVARRRGPRRPSRTTGTASCSRRSPRR